LKIRFAHNRPALHGPMFLRAGNFIDRAYSPKLGSDTGILGSRSPQVVGVIEPHGMADTSRADALLAAISERQGDRVIGKPGLDLDRTLHFSIVDLDLDNILVEKSVLLGSFAADKHQTVPNGLCDRIRKLLQPAVVVVAAVIHLVVAM